MARSQLVKTLRFADHACRDAALLCGRHARAAWPEAAALLREAADAARAGEAAAHAVLMQAGGRRRLSRVFTRPLVAVWGWGTSLAGDTFTLEMAAHVTRKLGMVLEQCARLCEDEASVERLHRAAGDLTAVHQRITAEAAQRRAGERLVK